MSEQIEVRLFENARYGTTFGKGKYRKAIFNGTADLRQRDTKYLLDMEEYNVWQHSAKTDADIEVLKGLDALLTDSDKAHTLATWILRWDVVEKTRTKVAGVAWLDLETNKLRLLIEDAEMELADDWDLQAKTCRANREGKKAPNLLATNYDIAARS
jgi:hypothetical protein